MSSLPRLLVLALLSAAGAHELYLSPWLKSGQASKARELSEVKIVDVLDGARLPLSHSGYITVDEDQGKNTFFWFFPSSDNNAPLLVWLNGGPGISSMLGVFWEHGPVRCVTADGTKFKPNPDSWTNFASVLYIDNPIGVGFSHQTSDPKYIESDMDTYTADLYSFLDQFLQIFSDFKNRDLYIGGQSYAGKYVPSIAHLIKTKKDKGETDIRLKGVYLGGPLFDPLTQIPDWGLLAYSVGVISLSTYTAAKEKAHKDITKLGGNPYTGTANEALLEYVAPVFTGVSGGDNYVTQETPGYACVAKTMSSDAVRTALHAGKRNFNVAASSDGFGKQFFASTKSKMADLMNYMKVLLYTGDYDMIVSPAMAEAALTTTPWDNRAEYNAAARKVWLDDKTVLGYYSKVGKFCRVTVRAAGHQTPYDQPAASRRMMEAFISKGCVS